MYELHRLVKLFRNVRIIDLNLSVGITNLRRLNLIFIPSVTVKHYILYKFTLIFIYIFISKIIIKRKRRLTPSVTVKH